MTTRTFSRRRDQIDTVYARDVNQMQAAIEELSVVTTEGDLLIGGSAGAEDRLAIGTAGKFLRSNAAGTKPEYVRELPYTSQTATYTALVSDTAIDMNCTSGARTINLPAAATAGAGKAYWIAKLDTTANALTIDASGAETIDNALTMVLYGRVSVVVMCTGSDWRVVQGRQFVDDYLRPEWFGAAGDGTTDDNTALARCLSACSASGRSTLKAGPKTYLNGASLFPAANTVVDGVAGKTTFKMKGGVTAFNFFQSGGVNNVGYRNFTLDLNKANTTAPGAPSTGAVGIYWAPTGGNSTGNFAENVTIKDAHGPVLRFQGHNGQTDPANLNPGELWVRNCKFSNSQYGPLLLNVTAGGVLNCMIEDMSAEGIFISMARGLQISNNLVEDCGANGVGVSYIDGCTFANNTFRRNALSGFSIGGGSASNAVNRNFTVTGNVSHNNTQHGFTCDPTITTATLESCYATYTGNVAYDNGTHGMYFQCVKHTVITGNECAENTQAGIAVQGLRCAITGNHLHNNGTYGLNLQGGATTTPTPGYHVISPNNIHDNATANLLVTSYNEYVDGATGSKTHDWASLASGAEATTTVTVYGAALGQIAHASMEVSLAGLKMTAFVSAKDTVTVVLRNDTGGAVDLASSTLRALVGTAA